MTESTIGTENTGPLPPAQLWHGAGIIVVDKPCGPSSHQVAAWVGKMLGCQVGHAGTLDPQVSGVLLVMLSNAVRLAPLLLKHDKEYVCLMRLHRDVERSRIEQIVQEFTGRIYQRPPKKSAVKRNLRIRTIHRIDLLSVKGRLVLFRVTCDAGTYIRSLCHHMGLALGAGAHMQELRRTRSGTFDERSAHTLHAVQDACVAAAEGNRSPLDAMIVSVDAAVPDLPVVVVRDTAIDALCRGAALAGVGVVRCDEFKRDQPVAVLSQKNEFVGLGRGLVASSAFKPGDTGLVVAMTTVFLPAGTYSRGWTKKEHPKKVSAGKPEKRYLEKKRPEKR
ncbi:MAG: RNA-guided pseudouridylation complex pseudouridine synthase subunit Cbf5 [Methanoregula sp.]|nr:RNA-guided pseudouridylation complex pseudouridine synthase subunit Cbf5 [Methanoregula sp.]